MKKPFSESYDKHALLPSDKPKGRYDDFNAPYLQPANIRARQRQMAEDKRAAKARKLTVESHQLGNRPRELPPFDGSLQVDGASRPPKLRHPHGDDTHSSGRIRHPGQFDASRQPKFHHVDGARKPKLLQPQVRSQFDGTQGELRKGPRDRPKRSPDQHYPGKRRHKGMAPFFRHLPPFDGVTRYPQGDVEGWISRPVKRDAAPRHPKSTQRSAAWKAARQQYAEAGVKVVATPRVRHSPDEELRAALFAQFDPLVARKLKPKSAAPRRLKVPKPTANPGKPSLRLAKVPTPYQFRVPIVRDLDPLYDAGAMIVKALSRLNLYTGIKTLSRRRPKVIVRKTHFREKLLHEAVAKNRLSYPLSLIMELVSLAEGKSSIIPQLQAARVKARNLIKYK